MEGKVFGGRNLEIYFGNPIDLIPYRSRAFVGEWSFPEPGKKGDKFPLKPFKRKCHLLTGRFSLIIDHSIFRSTSRSFADG
jgi:hypothetical protein